MRDAIFTAVGAKGGRMEWYCSILSHRRWLTRIVCCIALIQYYYWKNTRLDSLDCGKWLQSISQVVDIAQITPPPRIRISFQLHDPNTLKLHLLPTTFLRCPLGEVIIGKGKSPSGQIRTGELPPLLVGVQNAFGKSKQVLDFTVTLSTDLKLFFVGDSVMQQFAQVIDESFGGRNTEARKILWKTGGVHESGTVLAPTRGGGVSAFWRMTGLLSKSKMGSAPANSPGGGWNQEQIDLFLNHSYQEETSTDNIMTTVGSFDVVVLRVMHGWMQHYEITHERIVEAILLSFELLGATTVVLMTVPFTNNVKSVTDMDKVREINEDIREIARTWNLRMDLTDKYVQHILVIEYGMYCNQIIWSNARHLNYSVSPPLGAPDYVFDLEGPSFLLDRLDDAQLYGNFPPSVSMVCNDEPKERGKCNRNYLFLDGMHICPETIASRFTAGVACLLGCVYNGRGTKRANSDKLFQKIRICETNCNKQFLSVMPVEESWIDTNTTLAAFSD